MACVFVDLRRSLEGLETLRSLMTMKHGDYPVLPSPSHIRIVKFEFDQVQISFQASFEVIDLNDPSHHEYNALSYACGDPEPIGYIEFLSIPSRPLLGIGANLFQALQRFRSFKLRGANMPLLWIDAVCINQGDPDERAQQVKLMHRIFGSAFSVMAWLGPGEDEDLSATKELLHKFANPTNDDDGGLKVWVRNFGLAGHMTMGEEGWATRNKIIQRLFSSTTEQELELLGQFFGRAWFTRLWVVQEAVTAKSLLMLCGNNMAIFYDTVGCAAGWYYTVIATYGPFMSLSTPVKGSATTVINMRNDYQVLKKKLLLERLAKLERFDASEPRDKVFALVGIMRIPPAASELLEVDYRKPVFHVLIDAARAVLLGGANLDILVQACCFDRPFQDMLPSWVPNREYRPSYWNVSPYRFFDATKGRTMTILDTRHRYELRLRGTKRKVVISSYNFGYGSQSRSFAHICMTICLLYSIQVTVRPDIPNNFDEIFAEMTTCGIEILDQDPVNMEAQLRDEFRDFAFFWARSVGLRTPVKESASDAQVIIDRLSDKVNKSSFPAENESHILVNRYAQAMFATCAAGSAVSISGHWGVCAKPAEEGDIVTVLEGGRFPMILRRVQVEQKAADPSHNTNAEQTSCLPEEALRDLSRVSGQEYWRLVGPAYISDLMNGEAFAPDKDTGSEPELEDYSII